MMFNVLEGAEYVMNLAKHVRINTDQIASVVAGVTDQDLELAAISPAKRDLPLEVIIPLITAFNVVDYCFWAEKGQPKWTVERDGETIDGAMALFRCLEVEAVNNPDFISGKSLANLTAEELDRVLKGNVQIPMFVERLDCLHEAGRVLVEKFGSSFWKLYLDSQNNATKMTELLVDNFSSFDDTAEYQSKRVGFYKRAQLNAKMVSDALVRAGKEPFEALEQLTAFADYKVPQILRRLGILEYSEELASKVDTYQLIPKGSSEEVEMRAADVWAVKLMGDQLKPRYSFITASHVDCLLWNRSQTKTKDEKPYHRTYTIYY